MQQQLELTASHAVRSILSEIGRTEDVRFSPDNRLLVLAGFGLNHLLILRIGIEMSGDRPRVIVDDFMELTSSGITRAHGVDFLDDRTLAVANRDGLVSILEIPPGELAGRHSRIDPIRELSGGIFCKLKSPGSVAARHDAKGRISLLVCNNYTHRVTQHVVDPARGFRVRRNRVLLERSLAIPDGVAVSCDERWIAISNHNTHEVLLFDAAAPLGRRTEPAGILSGAGYPHGLRFTPDDRYMLVADAGAPLVHVYERGDGWGGTRGPVNSVKVLDEETFNRGRTNPQEGGPKGLDIDRSGAVVAITCEEQPVAFFALADIVAGERLAPILR